MAAWTPYAGQLILPQVGHAGMSTFHYMALADCSALLQDSKFFGFAVQYFLEQEFNERLPVY
jgi:hypothetical protein